MTDTMTSQNIDLSSWDMLYTYTLLQMFPYITPYYCIPGTDEATTSCKIAAKFVNVCNIAVNHDLVKIRKVTVMASFNDYCRHFSQLVIPAPESVCESKILIIF
jgi:hypothetical protein